MARHAGIDVGRDSFFVCVIDDENRAISFPDRDLKLADTIEWIVARNPTGACLDGPPQPNQGRLHACLPADSERNTNRRVAEFQLGIGGCYGTPATRPQSGATNAWMTSGMDLYSGLTERFLWKIDLGCGQGELIETHPTYAFKALLDYELGPVEGGIPHVVVDRRRALRPKKPKGVGGQAQRIELLRQACQESGLVVSDENTIRWESRIDWVDATICALVRYWKTMDDPGMRPVGDGVEGTIYLRVPRVPFSVRLYHKLASQGSSVSLQQRAKLDPPPNAIILRLGENGPGGLSQADTIELALLAADEGECWIPVGTNHQFKLVENLSAAGNLMYLAFGNELRLRIMTGNCVFQPNQQLPYCGEVNPWPVETSQGWVEALEVQDVIISDFQTIHGGAWGGGFTNRGANLLWARVNEGQET